MKEIQEIDLQRLYENYSPPRVQNQIVKGRVVAVSENEVLVSIGHKAEGRIPLSEWHHDEPKPQVGDQVEVYVESIQTREGTAKLSRRLAHSLRTWQVIKEAHDKDVPIEGVVRRRTKGGFVVDINGIEAFLPGSQVDVRPLRASDNYDDLVGRRMRFKVVKINEAQHNVVVSHKALIEEELQRRKEKIMSILERGQVLEGTVKNIASFGIFVDLGGVIDGLVHISDLSWGRVNHPEELYKIGDKVQVVVLDYDPETGRVNLGIKQLTPNPWENPPEWLKEAAEVEGKVVAVAEYGLTVEVVPGIEGILPVFELAWSTSAAEELSKYKVGDIIKAKVIQFDPTIQRLTLSIKQLRPDPWLHAAEKYPVGSTHKGIVRNHTNIGTFVELEPGIEGFINLRDLSWFRRIKHPSELFQKGQEIDVVVLEIDPDHRRLRLGYKQLTEDPWDMIKTIFREGSHHEGIVEKISEVGAVVSLAYGVEGFCPMHYLKVSGELPKEGESQLFRVVEVDDANRTIVLARVDRPVAGKPTRRRKGEAADTEATAPAALPEPVTRAQKRETLGDLEAISRLKALLQEQNTNKQS
jgi:small subunit ribosomal protein S1